MEEEKMYEEPVTLLFLSKTVILLSPGEEIAVNKLTRVGIANYL
jgi:hypothetical protein